MFSTIYVDIPIHHLSEYYAKFWNRLNQKLTNKKPWRTLYSSLITVKEFVKVRSRIMLYPDSRANTRHTTHFQHQLYRFQHRNRATVLGVGIRTTTCSRFLGNHDFPKLTNFDGRGTRFSFVTV